MYVYILQDMQTTTHFYVGSTSNLKNRISYHNQGLNQSTKSSRPWVVIWYCWFPKPSAAESFEKYLKSGSGTVFRRRHLATTP